MIKIGNTELKQSGIHFQSKEESLKREWLYKIAYSMLKMYESKGKRKYLRDYRRYKRLYIKAGGKLNV